ncbi:MAG: SDR family NAD(P)-dependent oxidoreductase [Myxococcota bacterium]
MESGLKNKVVLVTGASGGIGAAVVRMLVQEGALPVLHAHRGRDRAEALARELGEAPRSLPVVSADLADADAVTELWSDLQEQFPRVDAVVANAGVWPDTPAHAGDLPPSRWRHTVGVNLDGVFHVVGGFFRHLADVPREEAAVVLVGSTAGLFGEAGHSDYAATKAALAFGLTPSWKNEIVALAPRGRVNCVCPGWTATPMAAEALQDPDVVGRALATTPLEKVATPEDVARSIVFLCSPLLAGHLSGVVLPVHGGMEGRRLR